MCGYGTSFNGFNDALIKLLVILDYIIIFHVFQIEINLDYQTCIFVTKALGLSRSVHYFVY